MRIPKICAFDGAVSLLRRSRFCKGSFRRDYLPVLVRQKKIRYNEQRCFDIIGEAGVHNR